MSRTYLFLSLAGAALLCGCGKQTQINTAEIKILSQQMVQLQQSQAKQIAAIQSQLAALAPTLDKINNFYFEKTRDDALSYHTNTLYLLLAVDKNIESELQVADTEREAASSLAYAYHTNEVDMLHFYAARIENGILSQESQMEDKVNAESKRVVAELSEELTKQIKLATPDAAETTRRTQLETDVAQIKRDVAKIAVQLAQMTNQPAAQP